jgi:AraC family transcriptional regulator, transcriptional activator of pobA
MKKDIKKYGFKTGLPQEFEIVDLSELYSRSRDILTQLHRAGFYHIIWFQACNVTHWVDFKPIKIKPNSLLLLNKNVAHRFDDNEQVKGKVLLFTDSFFCKTESDSKFLRQCISFNDFLDVTAIEIQSQLGPFSALMQLIIEEFQAPTDEFKGSILHKLLYNLLLFTEREKYKLGHTKIKKGADLDYVMLFKDLLEADFRSHKQVSYYSKKIAITEKRLNQATSKALGKAPKEVINDRVLVEAKRLLANTSESIKEIAYYLGFEEPTNFIKYFKKNESITPTEFREKHTLA